MMQEIPEQEKKLLTAIESEYLNHCKACAKECEKKQEGHKNLKFVWTILLNSYLLNKENNIRSLTLANDISKKFKLNI